MVIHHVQISDANTYCCIYFYLFSKHFIFCTMSVHFFQGRAHKGQKGTGQYLLCKYLGTYHNPKYIRPS